MKKLALLSTIAVVAAACADSPTMPNAGDPLLSHVTQTGSAYHGYDAPFVEEPVVDGNDVTLCADWTDLELADFVAVHEGVLTGNPPNHYSFEYEVWDADANEGEGAWVPVATVNGALGDPTGQDGCLDLVLDDGTYLFRVKSTAHVSIAGDRTNHHTEWAEFEVVVGSGFHSWFTQSPGQSDISDHDDGYTESITDLSRTSANWSLQFMILKNLVPVTECAPTSDYDDVTVVREQSWSGGGATATFTPNDCDEGVYHVNVANSAPGSGQAKLASSGTLTVMLDDDAVVNVVSFASSN